MESLSSVLKAALLNGYTGGGHNLKAYLLSDEQQGVYSVLAIEPLKREHPAGIVVMARIVEPYICIEEDNTDYPLSELLANMGIPAQHIIRRHMGESIPDPIAS